MDISKVKFMFHNLSIAWRLILCITVGVAIVMGLILGGSYYFIEETLAKNLAQYAHSLALDIAGQTGAYLKKVEDSNQVLALEILSNKDDKERIANLLKKQLSSSDIIFGVCAAYEPVMAGDKKIFPDFSYAYYGSDKIEVLYESPYSASFYERNNAYLYEREWYNQPKQTKRSMWIEPYSYTDNDGKTTLIMTYSTPLFKDSEFIGVVGTDVSIDWFAGGLGSWILKKLSYAFILSPNGTFLANTSEELAKYQSISGFVRAQQNELLTQTVENMAKNKSGFVEIKKLINNEDAWFIYLPIADSGWTLGVFVPEYKLVEIAGILVRLQLVLGGGGFVLLLIVISLLVRTITGPLRELNNSVQNISKDLHAELPDFAGNDEVAVLARSYKTMVNELKINMKVLELTTAAKEKIESELRIAHSIQMSLVPKQIPAFPEHSEFDIHAVLTPAREVGGDFYDFFLLDDDHLCIVIGDVSGKGIPAAIFMAVVRTLVQAFAKTTFSPGALLQAVNNELAKNNENCMFVTLFCAVVSLSSGECRFANGGHNLPIVIERAAGEVKVSRLPKTKGCLVGVMESEKPLFAEEVFTLSPDSTLFMYTDGINEAENQKGGFYGDERLMQTLSASKDAGCRELIETLQQDVAVFAAGYEQSDDITAVAFDYRKNERNPYICSNYANRLLGLRYK